MNNKFKEGQQVQCINNTGAPELTLNACYTINHIRDNQEGVMLNELKAVGEEYKGYFKIIRFRPLDELDMEWVEEVLSEVVEEELVEVIQS